MPKCDQCQPLAINGVATHETGCVNSWLHPATMKPFRRQCKACDGNWYPKSREQARFEKYCYNCRRDLYR